MKGEPGVFNELMFKQIVPTIRFEEIDFPARPPQWHTSLRHQHCNLAGYSIGVKKMSVSDVISKFLAYIKVNG